MAVAAMLETGAFSEADTLSVWAIIMATVVSFGSEGVMRQSATDSYVTQILADADLATLGGPTEIYWDRVLRLYREIKKTDKISTQDPFFAGQAAFVEVHRFYTPEADILFANKTANIAYTERAVAEGA